MFFFHDSVRKIMNIAQKTFYSMNETIKKMITKQRMLYAEGEDGVYNEAIKLLKNNDN